MVETKKFVIELTNDCNLSCEMCPRKYLDMVIGYITRDLWDILISQIPLGSTVLPFWRGEPTLHPDFREMIKSLEGYNVVLATNGTDPDAVLDVMDCLDVVNVSLHGKRSYDGYKKIAAGVYNSSPLVIASTVEGEEKFTENARKYMRHTVDGVWGKVENVNGKEHPRCSRLDETVIAWDGRKGMCCYVWDITNRSACSKCSQWAGGGKTL